MTLAMLEIKLPNFSKSSAAIAIVMRVGLESEILHIVNGTERTINI